MGFENLFGKKGQTATFGPSQPNKAVEFPYGYRESVNWVPRIGDIFPNFRADSTHGSIDFHSWAEGRWLYFFSHPSVKSGVSATEIAGIASSAPYFRKRNVEILGICAESAADHARWQAEIGRLFHLHVDFPVIDDREMHLSRAFGMIHPKERGALPIRKSFIIDPALRVRMIFEYPVNVGRSMDETLRVIDALQIVEHHRVGIPGDWEAGDSVLVAPYINDEEARRTHGQVSKLAPFLRMVPMPEDNESDGLSDISDIPDTQESIYGAG